MRYIGQRFGCSTDILYAGNDHWAPVFHMQQLTKLQAQQIVPDRDKLLIVYKSDLQHDFVSRSEQIPIVMEFCVNRIQRVVVAATTLTSNQHNHCYDSFVAIKQPLHSRL